MESTFHATVYSVVDRLLDRISTECLEDKPKLWAIWKEMFAFPQDPPKKEVKKVEAKPEAKDVKEVKKETKPEPKKEVKKKETKPEVKAVVPEKQKVVLEEEKAETKPETKAVVEEEKVQEKVVEKKPEVKAVVEEKKPEPKPVVEEKPAAKAIVMEEEEPEDNPEPAATPTEEKKSIAAEDLVGKNQKELKAILGTCPWVYSKGPRMGQVCGSQIYSKQPDCGLCHAHFKK